MLLDGAELDAPAGPLNDLLRIGLDSAPDEIAIVSVMRALTWRELDRASAALAGGYRALGLEPGDRLASLMPNRIDLVVHYLACFRAGVIATPLNYRYTAREIDHALEVSGARALLAHVERAEDIAASERAAASSLGRSPTATRSRSRPERGSHGGRHRLAPRLPHASRCRAAVRRRRRRRIPALPP